MKDESFGVVPVLKKDNDWLYLLVQHKRKDGKGHWAFPKGHKEDGETDVDAAKRELAEETGIVDIRIINEPIATEQYTFWFDKILYDKTVTYFLGISLSEDVVIQEREISDYGWISYNEAMELMSFEGGKNTLKAAQKYLEENIL